MDRSQINVYTGLRTQTFIGEIYTFVQDTRCQFKNGWHRILKSVPGVVLETYAKTLCTIFHLSNRTYKNEVRTCVKVVNREGHEVGVLNWREKIFLLAD